MVGDRVVATFAGDFVEVGDGLLAILTGLRLVETTAYDKTQNINVCKKVKIQPNTTSSYLSAAAAAQYQTAGCPPL